MSLLNKMDSNVHVLLYSKFSQACRKFIDTMENIPLFKDNVTLLCVDNKDVRNRILSNSKLNIKEVPCIIRIYDSGYTEIFEGNRSFEVLLSYRQETPMAQQMTMPMTPQQMPMSAMPQQMAQMPMSPQQMSQMSQMPMSAMPQQPQQMTAMPQMAMSAMPQQMAMSSMPQMAMSAMPQQPQQMAMPPQKNKGVSFSTPLDELSDDDSSMNTYLHIPKNDKDLSDNDSRSISRAIKNDSQKESAMAKALLMQKERESSDTPIRA